MAIENLTIGCGCFWCYEAVYQQLKGVNSVLPGYAGGGVANPSYEQVCSGATSHAEVLHIQFDPAEISFHTLLLVFFNIHDPTTLNRQGADVGTQYRSIILYHNQQQKSAAEKLIAELDASQQWSTPIVTELKRFEIFYEAEKYHQNYYNDHLTEAYCQAVIKPKISKLKQNYSHLL